MTLVMPCGTGKTQVAAELQLDLDHRRIVVLVPTIVLLAQIATDLQERDPHRRLILVCSREPDAVEGCTEEESARRAGFSVTTSPVKVKAALSAPGTVLVIATYASAQTVNKAAQAAGIEFDLAIADEAHRTAGHVDKVWGLIARSEFRANRRLFMTATPRIVEIPDGDLDDSDEVALSMDGSAYGPHIAPLTFREAINEGHLSKYHVAVIGVRASQARNLAARAGGGSAYTATDAAAHLALAQIRRDHPHVQSVLAYHNLVDRSRLWSARLEGVFHEIAAGDPELADTPLVTFHMDSTTPAEERALILKWLGSPDGHLVVVSNCRVLTEGVNVPALDAVVFAAPRSSTPDIVQIVGRAMRVHRDVEGRPVHDHPALVIVPVLVEDGDDDVDSRVAVESHRAAWRILQSLAIEDVHLQKALVDWHASVSSGTPFYDEILSVQIPAGITAQAQDFFVRHVADSVPPLYRVLALVRQFHSETAGLDFPKSKWTPLRGARDENDELIGYSMRPKVDLVRQRKADGTLAADLVRHFEDIPGWTWEREIKRRGSKMVDVIAHAVAQGIITNGFLPRIQPVVMDGHSYRPDTWFWITKKAGKLLGEKDREHLRRLIPRNFSDAD